MRGVADREPPKRGRSLGSCLREDRDYEFVNLPKDVEPFRTILALLGLSEWSLRVREEFRVRLHHAARPSLLQALA